MRKKLPYIFLAIVIFIQICVPVGMIVYQKIDSNLARAKGEKFMFVIDRLSYSHDGKLHFDINRRSEWKWEDAFAEIEVAEDGFANLILTDDKPKSKYYIKSSSPYTFEFPIDEIDTDAYENIYSMELNKYYDYNEFGYYNEAYLEAYVYKGRVDAVKIYIDGMEADEYLKKLDEKIRQENIA